MSSFIKTVYLFLAVVLIGFGVSCLEKPTNPFNTEIADFPTPPNNIRVSVGDRVVTMTWLHPDVGTVMEFKIYRQDSTNLTFRNIGSTEGLSYSDRNLNNNQEYRYQISAVGVDGLEGKPSEVVSAVPAIFGVLINSGQEFTNSRNVSLSLTAPAITTLVRVSNDSLFSNSQFQTFSRLMNWTLSRIDGPKAVFVKFRDAQDRETDEPYSDAIILDTRATIRQVLHDGVTRILTPADTIHFMIIADEPGGNALVNVNGVQSGINLFDNGTNGDLVPDDGTYEVDYVIPTGPEVESTLVVGQFVDRVGNVAPNLVSSSGRITIRRPPTPVKLIAVEPLIGSSRALNLFWSVNSDADFANYRIFRSLTPGVDTEEPLVTILQNQATIAYRDSTLAANTTYHYRIYVYDVTGLFFGSNELGGTTNPN